MNIELKKMNFTHNNKNMQIYEMEDGVLLQKDTKYQIKHQKKNHNTSNKIKEQSYKAQKYKIGRD